MAVYDTINKAWLSASKVVFGQEVGTLSDCAEWLREYEDKLRMEKSSFSGEIVTLSFDDYAPHARFAAFDEIDFGKKFAPLSINEIKDIDSIACAVKERAIYTGNIVLGHSSQVQDSNNVVDSHFVLESTAVLDSKYVAYSRHVQRGEYCFGLLGAVKDSYVVKSMGSELSRCFECHQVELLSDCYYCAKVLSSRDCMFCFGVENGSHMIGNTKLEKGKYSQLKAKLVSEIAGEISKSHRIFSIYKLIEKCAAYPRDSRLNFRKIPEPPFDINPIEKAFTSASSLLFGKDLSGIKNYSRFLGKHVPGNVPLPSVLSGTRVLNSSYRAHILKRYDLAGRMANEDEVREIGRLSLDERQIEAIEMDIGKLCECLHPIVYTNLDKVAGHSKNFKDSTIVIDSQDCLEGSAFMYSKRCAYSFWPLSSEAVFGCWGAHDSSYSMKLYYSKKMMRALECDSCESCADVYFAHNCENVRDSMFCFNAKNLTYAIGNAALPAEQYRGAKAALVQQLAIELEEKKDLRWGIFNVGAGKKG